MNAVFAKLIECDGCREAYEREDAPYPEVGDFCELCVLTCDHCDAEYSDRDMVRDWAGDKLCPECDDDHGPAALAHYNRALATFNRPPASPAEFMRAKREVL